MSQQSDFTPQEAADETSLKDRNQRTEIMEKAAAMDVEEGGELDDEALELVAGGAVSPKRAPK